jgi:hypothetical protein
MVWRASEGVGRPERPAWWLVREAQLELSALMAEEADEEETG